MNLLWASVEVRLTYYKKKKQKLLSLPYSLFYFLLLPYQLNQMEGPVSTTTGFTKTGKSSVQTANINALAWTVLLGVSLSVHVSFCYPDRVASKPKE